MWWAYRKKTSQLVDRLINPFVPHIKSFVKYSTHVTSTYLLIDAILCTLDISSLCTSILLMGSKQSVNYLAVYRGPAHLPLNSYATDLLMVVLENNCFEFDGKYYHQLAGIAMEIKLACSYANILIANFRTNIFILPKPTLTLEEIHIWYLLISTHSISENHPVS